ncbi:hypothetical protein E1A91_D03G188100v1 [Gossypium mustelinum]|uniref:PGG domain-containing protein n=3 Tax=Gossypium TaxID=3633 RepID=A0A0D2QMJ2_GOSRA|nr:ankyrin repeat-containing protein BDA1 [Gossypium raimondii]KJB20994.1 hypothetical protein B456_003G176800 [Gossypium raimondii]TYI91379.1 hypothetical protein E1A91_D03G188100v1 [Gossypium mustelinum]
MMSTNLIINAATNGDIDALYELIAEDPHALDYSDSQPCVLTPLHIAVAEGNTNFALEIMKLYPSLSKKLDPSGWCPFHVALLNNQIATVFRLLETEPDLVRLKGREGLTSLHLAVGSLDGIKHNLLREFLAVSPLSITDTTNRGQTALHIAVNNGNTEALKVLLSFLRRSMYRNALYWEHKVLNWKDENGETVLHVAVKKNDIEAVKLLLNCNIKVNARNLHSYTAVDIAIENNNSEVLNVLNKVGAKDGILIEEMKQLTLEAKPTLLDNVIRFVKGQKIDISSETRDALLVVAALVATATFQAVLSPPGGLRQADSSDNDSLPFSKVGKVVMKEWLFIIFLILNGTSFWVTIITIYLLLPTGFYGQLLTLPLILFSITYLFCSTIISPSLVCAIVNFSFFIFCVALLSLGVVLVSNRSLLSYIKKLWPRCR